MDFRSMADKAKDLAGRNPDKADDFVEKGEAFANERMGGHEEQVDAAGNRAKDYLHGPEGGAHGDPAAGQQPQGEPDPQGQVPPPPPGEPQPGEPQPPR